MLNLIECKMCKREISPNAKFCPNCGEPIDHSNFENDYGFRNLHPILEVNGEIFCENQYRDGFLLIFKNFTVITNMDKTQIYAKLEYNSIQNLDCTHKKRKREGGFLRDTSYKTFFNRVTNEELLEFRVKDKKELKLFEDNFFELILDIKRNPMRYLSVRCPSCGSNNLKRIDEIEKAGKILLFGIFAIGDVGKTFLCQDCQYKW